MIFVYIGIAVFLAIIYYHLSTQQNAVSRDINRFDPELDYYGLNDGNQTALVIGLDIDKSWFNDVNKKYKWTSFNEYDNRLWEYAAKLFDDTIKDCGIEEEDELWRALNRPQKIFWSFLVFTGDIDNGGVYQFLFNRPEFTFSVFEMLDELSLLDLKKDYKNVIHELSGKVGTISELKTTFNDNNVDFEKRWNEFAKGSYDLQSARVIENYFHTKSFKKIYLKKMADYIEANMEMFAAIV
jgi:hypothetical protein